MKLLGIDVGTGGSRALAIDEEGRVAASATVEHEPFASPQTGWAEQDARDWWRASAEAVRAVMEREALASTALLDIHAAVPHARLSKLETTALGLAIAGQGLYERYRRCRSTSSRSSSRRHPRTPTTWASSPA